MIEALILDLDDTLVQESAARRAAARSLLEFLSTSEDEEQFIRRWSAATVKHFDRYLRGEISFDEQRRCRARECVSEAMTDRDADRLFEKYALDYERNWQLFPDVEPFISRHVAMPMVLITNGQSIQQRAKARAVGLEPKVRGMAISEEIGFAKPAPEIFLAASKVAGVDPQKCLCVGDNLATDVRGAQAVGMTAVLLDRAQTSPNITGIRVVPSLSQVNAHAL